jgi:hypothetical protein
MSTEEQARLQELDQVLASPVVRKLIAPVIMRVRAELARNRDASMAWEPIPLEVYGNSLPTPIRSSWVFILRAGFDTGAERHPNSHQRMMSLQGAGDMWTQEAGNWKSNFLTSDPDALLERRWISIPQNVWHRPVISKNGDWVVVSFHTVPAEELIEERPISSESSATTQRRYLDS